MAASELAGLTRSHTNPAGEYDHPIKLLDTTKPKPDPAQVPADDAPESSGAALTRRWTRGTLRKQLAKRKYAKWQQRKGHIEGDPGQADTTPDENDGRELFTTQPQSESGPATRPRQKKAAKSKKTTRETLSTPDTMIDVLYENQRGWFLFGMPLYSSASLLNFDPAGWQTSLFQDSPVNITNAQVPDPSWEWAWRTWYVDMSHDVDEEGWEYSFSFQPRFAWHGSHPWFHSFARRRRWLRKRVKVHPSRLVGGKGTMKDAHRLTADYFTIHGARRDRSPDSSGAGTSGRQSSYLGYDGAQESDDSDQDVHDIPNVVALLAALRKATVDREKIVAVRTFLAQGGEELHYLADNMGEIMGLLIYQTSRQQLLDHILDTLDRAKEDLQQNTASEKAADDDEKDPSSLHRTIDNLSRALAASQSSLRELDYWKDAPESSMRGRSTLTVAPPTFNGNTEGKGDRSSSDTGGDGPEETRAHVEDANPGADIRGISKDAEIDAAPSLLRTAQEMQQLQEE
ncbi:MAG: hypothetical protein LQ345_005167 [Seirophora villosa]|nr:MAG: hypothetical protein LQ345_005167 [Seirophora villosa]